MSPRSSCRPGGGCCALALGATIVHILADILVPMVARHAGFHLPDLVSLGFWRFVLTLFLGYVIVIAVFYLMKRIVVGGRH